MGKKTWQYVDGGCPTCNASGIVTRPCPTWNDPKHTARTCSCKGGEFYDRCPNSRCFNGLLG